jgi:hypothetical protein
MKAKKECWYTWRELHMVEGEDAPRLLTPHGDPNEYEYPFDFLYPNSKEAIRCLYEEVENEVVSKEEADNWVLCKLILEPVHLVACGLCGKRSDAATAHRHQDGYIGDDCCWDERLRSTE